MVGLAVLFRRSILGHPPRRSGVVSFPELHGTPPAKNNKRVYVSDEPTAPPSGQSVGGVAEQLWLHRGLQAGFVIPTTNRLCGLFNRPISIIRKLVRSTL